MVKDRKMLGVSRTLHQEINALSGRVDLPMTVVLETLLTLEDTIDWETVRREYELRRPSWQNIRRTVQEYQVKYPDADDHRLAELSGYSVPQVETVTHTAHKRCLAYMAKNPRCKEKRIAEECGVSVGFASRIYKQVHEDAKIPRSERYLFDLDYSQYRF